MKLHYYFLFIICSLLFASCPVRGELHGLRLSGKIWVDPALTAQKYIVLHVNAYTPQGAFLAKSNMSQQEDDENGVFYAWEIDLFAGEGSAIVFWVEMEREFYTERYFAAGQQDVVSEGNTYNWTINKANVPLFSESDLRSIGVDFTPNQNFVLVTDITLTGSWKPLCPDAQSPFSGSFDGNGRTISNLIIEDGTDQYIGFFGMVKGKDASNRASIKNVKFILGNSKLDLSGVNNQEIGFAAAHAENTDFEDISVTTNTMGMTLNKLQGKLTVGGVAGSLSGRCGITNVSASVPIDVETASSGDVCIGGVVGKMTGIISVRPLTNGNIFRTYSPSPLTVSSSNSANVYIGGIVGYVDSASSLWFEECYVSGNISVSGAATGSAGGFSGGSGVLSGNSTALWFTRSILLTDKIILDYSNSNVKRGYFAGDTIRAGLEDYPVPKAATQPPLPLNYLVDDPGFTQTVIIPFAFMTRITRSSVTRDLFAGPVLDGALNWDFNQMWRWNAARGRPTFLWER